MKITRTGATRNAGTLVLAEEDLAARKRFKLNPPEWQPSTKEVCFVTHGDVGSSSYRYRLSFTSAELLSLIEVATAKLATDLASRALTAGAMTSLRELLVSGS